MFIAEFEKVSLKRFLKDYSDLIAERAEAEAFYDDIKLPRRATSYSAGYDMYLPFAIDLKPNATIRIPTGIRCRMEPGYVLKLYPRSSLGIKYQMGLLNTVGIIDADYYGAENEGHIIVGIINRGTETIHLNKGDRFVQGVFLAYYLAKEETVTNKRIGGFGSSDAPVA